MSGPELPSKKCELECYKPKLILNHFSNDIKGIQPVILEGAGVESTKRGTLKLSKEEMAFKYCFQIRKRRKCCGKLTDIVASEGN